MYYYIYYLLHYLLFTTLFITITITLFTTLTTAYLLLLLLLIYHSYRSPCCLFTAPTTTRLLLLLLFVYCFYYCLPVTALTWRVVMATRMHRTDLVLLWHEHGLDPWATCIYTTSPPVYSSSHDIVCQWYTVPCTSSARTVTTRPAYK